MPRNLNYGASVGGGLEVFTRAEAEKEGYFDQVCDVYYLLGADGRGGLLFSVWKVGLGTSSSRALHEDPAGLRESENPSST